MRYFLGTLSILASAGLIRAALENPHQQSIGKLLLAIPFCFAAYMFFRPLIFKPLEMMGFAVLMPSTVVKHNDRRFKEVNEHIKNGKFKLALEALDKILLKKPNWKDAQIRKIQLLGTNFYDIEKARAYGETVLLNGRFNRDKMHVLIVLGAMLRNQGYPNDAINLAFQCRKIAPKALQKLIDKMEDSWRNSIRSY